jgi:hypothetical protein
MPEKVTQQSFTRENSHFYIGTTEVPGVQTLRAEYVNNSTLMRYLGYSKYKTIPNGPQQGSVSVNSLLISNDYFVGLTGNSGFNGYVYNNKNDPPVLVFTSGYLSRYGFQYSFGSLPSIDASIDVFNNLGKYYDATTSIDKGIILSQNSNAPLKIPGLGVSLSINEFATNQVLGYSINLSCTRNPVYSIGNRVPDYVELMPPIQVDCNFQIQINDYNLKTLSRYPFNEAVENLVVSLFTFDTNQAINTFSFNNLEMNGEAYETSVNGAQAVNVEYRGYF